MTRLPRIKGTQLIAALHKIGFEVIRTKGSHHYLKHQDGRRTVVPVHKGETVGPGLLSKILKDCEITSDDLNSLL